MSDYRGVLKVNKHNLRHLSAFYPRHQVSHSSLLLLLKKIS